MAEPAPLSHAEWFARLRGFYSETGVQAWADTVPLHATSNPSLANSYALVIIRLVQEMVATDRVDPAQPFFVVELGAGTGKFGFHLARRLRELRQALGLTEPRIVQVMSDVAESNIEHWRSHPDLRPFLERGELVLARFDAEGDGAFELVPAGGGNSGGDGGGDGGDEGGGTGAATRLAAFANPLVVIANYVFDSLPQDLFRVRDGHLDEMLATTSPARDGRPAPVVWSSRPVVFPHYGEAELDAILAEAAPPPGSEAVMFPVTALRLLRRLADAAEGRLCLLASELGTGQGLQPEPALQIPPGNFFFYLPVDLTVIGQFFARLGPGIHRHQAATALDASLSVSGFLPEELRETRLAFSSSLEAFGARGRSAVATLLEQGGRCLNPEEWLAVSALVRYESTFLHSSVDLVLDWHRSERLPPTLKREVLAALRRFGAEVYWTPGAPDSYFDLGVLLCHLGELKAAVASFVRSIEMVGPSPETFVNLALALRALDRPADAVEALRDALAADPTDVVARGWLGRIELEMAGQLPAPGPALSR